MSGTTVDSSIARGFNPPTGTQANPLAQFAQIVGLANALAQNRRENETFDAQLAIGRALQSAMNPQTGQVDHEAFRRTIAGNPLAGFLAPQALAQARALEQGTLQVQQAQALLGQTRLLHLRQALQGLLVNPNVTRADVITAVKNLLSLPESERPFSAAVAASQLATLPSDPAGIQQWLLSHMASTQQGLQLIQRFLPTPTPVQTGGATVFVDTNPLTNQGVVGYSLPNEPSPAERNALVGRFNTQTQQMEWVQRQEAAPMVGGTGLPAQGTVPGAGTPPGYSGAAQGGSPALPPLPFGNGRYPGNAATPNEQSQQPPITGDQRPDQVPGALGTLPAPRQSSAIPAGPPLGAEEAARVTAQREAEQAAELVRQADQAPNIIADLNNLRDQLSRIRTGPGAQLTREVLAAYNRVAPHALQIGEDVVAVQEEFVKLATQLAQRQFQMLGGTGTNEQLASAMRTSPNEFLSRLGNLNIIALLQGNALAIMAKNMEWRRWLNSGRGPETYGQFSAIFNQYFDPRVFQAVYMTPESRRHMINSMRSQSERDRFEQMFRFALERGWIRLPTGNQNQAPSGGR